MSDTDIGMVDLGMSFNDMKEASKNKLLQEKVYQFRIGSVTMTETQAGRKRVIFSCEVLDDPSNVGEKIAYGVSLPWTDPATNEFSNKGINFLYSLCDGCGFTWEGTTPNFNAMKGLEFKAETKNKPDQNGEPRTEIKKIFKKA